ncbi:MAG TPA: protein kinase [Thermoanaerobaculia bacterium]|nr:protein kinase [Thermoanaerobaculia bacterium]
MTLSAGSRLGPYEIVSPLGAGGMGEVYRAKDTRLERTVAIKILASHLSASPEVRQRFEREAKTISQLSHPHICALHDVGREGDVEYLVMEYLEGETLADRLLKGSLPLEQTLRFGIQIADALDKAHRQGIVHRDLKPGNVMLTWSGVKLLDFGLAKAMALPSQQSSLTALPTQMNLTQEGTILGTFQYMAPEQLEGKEADARTDIFAFGCVLYEMATGKKAFSGATQASLTSSILRDEPQPISQVQPTSPPALDHVVKKSLAKDPEDRWQNAADLGGELKWIAEAGSQTGATAVAPQRRRRRDWLAWVAAGLLLLTTLFLGNEVRRLRSGDRVRAIHSYLDPPEKTTFRLTGDDSAPIAIAPDGTRAVFGAGGKLWLQSLAAGTVTPLAATDGGRFPFWSPDSRSIGFFSGGKLRVLDASGGPVQTICGAPNPRGGSWGRSGVIVFAPDVGTGLSRVAASGGSPAPLTVLTDRKKHTTHRWPYFLPDGKHVLYLAANHASPRSEDNGIYVASLDGGAPRRLMSSYGSAQYASGWLLSVRERSLMAIPFDAKRIEISGQPVRVADDANFDSGVWRGTFAASENGVLGYQIAREGGGGRLTWLDFSGRHLAPVAEKSPAYSPEMSPDGRRASVVMGDPNNDVWVYELDRGVQTRLTTDAEAQIAPVWSPDGSQIVFVQGLGGGSDFVLVTIAADGAGRQKEIYRSKERLEVSDWSRDGRYLLVDRGNIGASDIWAFPIADPAKAFPLVQSPFLEHSGQFSPDGKWVAYVSQHTGRDEVYVASFPSGGTRWQVSGSGGTQPRWSADGRELYFVSSSDDLTATAVDGSGPRFVVKDVRPLFRVNMYTGPRSGMYGYDVAPDGKRFLVNDAGEAGQARVALVVNWTAELK